MKAAVYRQYGPPEVVQVEDIPVPQTGPDDILVRVMATTVNRTDAGFRSAEYFISRFWSGLFRPKQPVLGCEFAGIVESVGSEISEFAPGDRVFGYNDARFGAHAEFMVMKKTEAICRIPENLNFLQAACLTEGAHYALCDIRAAKVKAGQHVLVYGATGAIGSAAVQLLRHFGATVTAVCNTKNVALIKSLGAHRVIDYQTEDFTASGETYDFIFDAVGKSSFGKCRPLLKAKGIYISTELGKGGQNVWLAMLTPVFGGKKLLFPLPVTAREDMEFLGSLAASGAFKPVIDRTYSLDEITEAHRYVASGQKTGNVVIVVKE